VDELAKAKDRSERLFREALWEVRKAGKDDHKWVCTSIRTTTIASASYNIKFSAFFSDVLVYFR